MSVISQVPLGALCAEAGISCPENAQNTLIRGVTADSRRVRQGWLFVAIRGIHRDGGDFIVQALARGAAAVLALPDTPVPSGSILLPHPAPRQALAYLCDAWYGHPTQKLRMIGITGTNGKTSVSSMLCHILKCANMPVGLIGTVGVKGLCGQPLNIRSEDETANMTTPDPEELYAILNAMAEEGASMSGEAPVVIMEVTSHALALEKVSPIPFECAAFTNLTPEHLDMHGDMEKYYEAKRRLFSNCRVAVVNGDGLYGERLISDPETAAEAWYICHTAPLKKDAERICGGKCCHHVYAGQSKLLGAAGVEYRLMSPHARVRITCPVPGDFTVENSMEAAVIALALGLSPARIKEALATFPGVLGRMERVPLEDHVGFSVFLDYAHTPDALENILNTVGSFRRRGERIVLLFGCGGDRDPSKRPLMAAIASRLADMVVITSDNSRTEDPMAIIHDILSGMDADCDHVVIPNRGEAIKYAISHARRGDVIILAGKGHEAYEIDRDGRHPFSEKTLVMEAVSAYHPKGGR